MNGRTYPSVKAAVSERGGGSLIQTGANEGGESPPRVETARKEVAGEMNPLEIAGNKVGGGTIPPPVETAENKVRGGMHLERAENAMGGGWILLLSKRRQKKLGDTPPPLETATNEEQSSSDGGVVWG